MQHLRVGEDAGQNVDRAAGYGGVFEHGNPRRGGGSARLGTPFGMNGDFAEARKLAVVADGQDHVAVR